MCVTSEGYVLASKVVIAFNFIKCREILLGSESEYGDFSKLIPKSNYETSIMQDRYKGKIKILRGIELGEPMHNAECTKKALCFAILT